ncbi:hypothetical protein MMC12_005911 [Toensbergia leucococca]|nr:hypothetical protein [Toensbergia leucococca]
MKLTEYLDISYASDYSIKSISKADFITATFPASAQTALLFLPTSYLSSQPLYDLLKGFKADLDFSSAENPFPINDESTLRIYSSRVAGTVAESCLELVYHHTTTHSVEKQRQEIVHAGGRMGIALQYINIARDVSVDARNSRVYIPTSWLREKGLTPNDIVQDPESPKSEALRQLLIDRAMEIYNEAKGAIEMLPIEARSPMRVAVESYMEIGRILRTPGYKIKAGRATVPKLRRLRVAWNALNQ